MARNGHLVYARGFGLGDVEAKTPVQPDSLFRIASISKPITAAAIMQLVERGKLKLDDHLVDLLDVRHERKPVPPGDPRLKDVTVRHLLQHRGGWDRDKSFDPMFRSVKLAKELGAEPPANSWQVITAMWSRPLDFEPGEPLQLLQLRLPPARADHREKVSGQALTTPMCTKRSSNRSGSIRCGSARP